MTHFRWVECQSSVSQHLIYGTSTKTSSLEALPTSFDNMRISSSALLTLTLFSQKQHGVLAGFATSARTTKALVTTQSVNVGSNYACSSSHSSSQRLCMSSTEQPIVAKTGGRGAVSASQNAYDKNLSLGAPKARPKGGHHMTRGGVQVTANVSELDFSASNIPGTSTYAIENLVNLLDDHKGALLSSSYEFPGR